MKVAHLQTPVKDIPSPGPFTPVLLNLEGRFLQSRSQGIRAFNRIFQPGCREPLSLSAYEMGVP